MNIALILSGGTGTRMQLSIPKQYIKVCDKPIIGYCLDVFQEVNAIDRIVVVCNSYWRNFISDYVAQHNISKVVAYADAGESRQASILNGLNMCENFANYNDLVIIHDAARPLVTPRIINELLCVDNYDGILPVLPVKDTMYYSNDGIEISSLLNRDSIYAGQAPECFLFGKYLTINKLATDDEIANTRGSSEIAFKNGLRIKLVRGDENNYKITTADDLKRFDRFVMEKRQ